LKHKTINGIQYYMLSDKLLNAIISFLTKLPVGKNAIILLITYLFSSSIIFAQDPEYSQFYANPIYLNPAFSGTTSLPKVHINFRNQWPSIQYAYVSFSASYDQYFSNINSGISVIMTGDQAGNGIYQTVSIGAAYSYQINFSDNFAMKAALQGYFYQQRLNFDKLFFYDQIDPVTGFYDPGNNLNPTNETAPINSTATYGDINFGLLAFTENVFFGATVKHLNQPIISFLNDYTNRLPMRYSFHAGAVLGDKDEFSFSPNIIYTQQADFRQLTGGAYLKFNKIFGGMWYRYNIGYSDALILSVGLQTGIMRTAYSYDITLQDLSSKSGGAHEISIILNFEDSDNNRNRNSLGNSLKCPTLF
jgi:type IX secretion system PorP/SprF family membrane protein